VFNEVQQTEIQTVEPVVVHCTAFEVEMATEKLKSHKSRATNKVLAQMIQADVKQYVLRTINILILLEIKNNSLNSVWSQSLHLR
jgi:hypothetical protein